MLAIAAPMQARSQKCTLRATEGRKRVTAKELIGTIHTCFAPAAAHARRYTGLDGEAG